MASNRAGVQLVLLAGGSGSRLWPLSRSFFPKQFLPLNGRATPLELVAGYFKGVAGKRPVLVVSSDKQVFGAAYNLLSGYCVLAEPCARNTAAAAGLAAAYASFGGADPVLLFSPSDYLIKDKAAFCRAVSAVVAQADTGRLAILGVEPSSADASYGYISLAGKNRGRRFVEKPSVAQCRRLLREGNVLWNTGIFAVKASLLMQLLRKHSPSVCAPVLKCAQTLRNGGFIPAQLYCRIPALSVEKAIFEKEPCFGVVKLNAGWTDIENWQSLYSSWTKDGSGNVRHGDALPVECSGSLFYAGKRLVAALGMKDVVAADTGDALLVCPRDKTAQVPRLTAILAAKGRLQVREHETVRRPWGSYTLLARGPNYLVKRLEISPGSGISLQYHRRRSEHWTVIEGVASVFCGKKKTALRPGQSADIPLGVVHSLSNHGRKPLEVVEVQNGSYIGEDDIVRLADPYRRPR